jgi:hypothetical protein
MTRISFQKYYSQAHIHKIPKQRVQIIRGTELRRGKVCKKELLFVKYNPHTGFVCLSDGKNMELSETQLRIFECLINAAVNGEVYVHGRRLLSSIGSHARVIGVIFQYRLNWHEFIDVTPKGYYRLNLYADEHRRQYKKCLLDAENRKHARDCL